MERLRPASRSPRSGVVSCCGALSHMPARKLRHGRREYGVEDEAGNTPIDPSATTKGATRLAAARLAAGRGESVYVFEVGEDSDGTHIVVDREEIRPPVEPPKSKAQIKREIDEVLARKGDPIKSSFIASIRLEGAPSPMQSREFKHRADAQTWLNQQREIADRRGWGGYKFELTEQYEVKRKGR